MICNDYVHNWNVWFCVMASSFCCFAMRCDARVCHAEVLAWLRMVLQSWAHKPNIGTTRPGTRTRSMRTLTQNEINIFRSDSDPQFLQSHFHFAQLTTKYQKMWEQLSRWDQLGSVESRAFSIAHIHSNMLAPGLSGINSRVEGAEQVLDVSSKNEMKWGGCSWLCSCKLLCRLIG